MGVAYFVGKRLEAGEVSRLKTDCEMNGFFVGDGSPTDVFHYDATTGANITPSAATGPGVGNYNITYAPDTGGLVVGQDFGWNAFVYDGKPPDDAGFLLTLLQHLESGYRIDPARIYMTGFSNGGGMTSSFAALPG